MQNFPQALYVEVGTEMYTFHSGSLQYGYKYEVSRPAIEVVINPEETKFTFDGRDTFRSSCSRGLDSIFRPHQPIPLVHSGRFGGAGFLDHSADMCPLRNFIYEQIKNDIKSMLEDSAAVV